jgi:hypothetical protein
VTELGEGRQVWAYLSGPKGCFFHLSLWAHGVDPGGLSYFAILGSYNRSGNIRRSSYGLGADSGRITSSGDGIF